MWRLVYWKCTREQVSNPCIGSTGPAPNHWWLMLPGNIWSFGLIPYSWLLNVCMLETRYIICFSCNNVGSYENVSNKRLHCLIRTCLQEEDPMTVFFLFFFVFFRSQRLRTQPFPAVPRCPAAQRSVVSLVYHHPWWWELIVKIFMRILGNTTWKVLWTLRIRSTPPDFS